MVGLIYADADFDNSHGSMANVMFGQSKHIIGTDRIGDTGLSSKVTTELIEICRDTSIICGVDLSSLRMAI